MSLKYHKFYRLPAPPKSLSTSHTGTETGLSAKLEYDADGNLLNDGWRKYTWDGEQRLLSVTTQFVSDLSTHTVFAYDARGRRFAKTVYRLVDIPSVGQQWEAYLNERYLYDGWNVLGKWTWVGSSWMLDQSYTWGLDLSGTPQEAGGVGGLVLVHFHNEPAPWNAAFPCYDGNGNVLALQNATAAFTGFGAAYDYDPFGNTVAAIGPLAAKNPFRFSTKYTDEETGLLYYGYRYYDARWGRWVSRDPIAEEGELNVLRFVHNNPVVWLDILGLAPRPVGFSRRMDALFEENLRQIQQLNDAVMEEPTLQDDPISGYEKVELHHPIPWNSKAFPHYKQPVVEACACLNKPSILSQTLLQEHQPMIALQDHRSRHTSFYHHRVRRDLEEANKKYKPGKNNPCKILSEVIKELINDILANDLFLYDNRVVTPPPPGYFDRRYRGFQWEEGDPFPLKWRSDKKRDDSPLRPFFPGYPATVPLPDRD